MNKQRTKWTPEEDNRLLELTAAVAPLDVIASELGRTMAAMDIRTRLLKRLKAASIVETVLASRD